MGMTIIELLASLAQKDIRLWLEQGNLKYSAPEGAFTKEIRDQIVSRKPEIIEFLAGAQKVSEKPIPVVDRDQSLPLSYAQQRMWILQQLEPESTAYNMSISLRLQGNLDPALLTEAFRLLIQKHEVLRTRFAEVKEQAVQVIDSVEAVAQWPLPLLDLSQLEESKQQARIQAHIEQDAEQPFDLQQDWPIRGQLLKLKDNDYVLISTQHHIASDGWSMGVLVQDIATAYAGLAQNVKQPLPPLDIQYADFAVWQRDWLEGDILEKQIQYWRDNLEGVELLEMPADFSRPAERTNNGAAIDFVIPAAQQQKINQLAQAAGVTPFQWLATAYTLLLHKYSGQTDICVGTPVANRNRAELESLIGFFVNTLAIRIQWEDDPSFNQLLKSVHQTTLDAYAHQDVPFERLVEELNVPRDMSHTPLFQTLFVLQNNPTVGDQALGDLSITPIEGERNTAKFDLTLGMVETDQGFEASLEYSTDLYRAETIQQLIGHFKNLLNAILNDPETPVSKLEVLTGEEKQSLVQAVQKGESTAHYQRPESLNELFEERVAQHGDSVAVGCEGETLTYNQLNAQANQLAHLLLEKGVKPNTLVGICLERSVTTVVSLLGVLKAGAAYLPLDPSNPEDRLSFILEDAFSVQDSKIVITQKAVCDNLPQSDVTLMLWDELGEALAKQPTENIGRSHNHASADHRAYVIYTSGTTGKPKGVLIPHRNVTRLLAATDHWFQFSENEGQDVWTLFHSFAFDFSVWEIWGPLLYGGRLVVVPYHVSRSPEDTYQLLVDEGVTILNQTPSAFTQLIQVDAQQSESVRNKLKLRELIFGGEALDFTALKQWRKHHSLEQPNLINMYGITETTVHVTYYKVQDQDLEQRASVIGVPIPDLQTVVLDPWLNPVPVGVPGELYVGGAGLALGYLNREELTQERFIQNPFNGDTRLYKTGDKVRLLRNGQLEYLGRMDDQVKIRGFRIELGEIESVLLQQDAVQDGVVLAREDIPGDKRLVAYIASPQGDDLDLQTIKDGLREQLPEYMVPSAYVVLEQLPLTSNGKINKKALPKPDQSAAVTTEYVAPRNELETRIATIWQDLLERDQVGVHDNFFDLGGHSIIATRVISRIREQMNVNVPLKALFKEPTVAGVAKAIEESGREETQPIVPVDRTQDIPLSYAQQRLWILDQLDPDSAAYNMPGAVRIRGPLKAGLVEQALTEILRRHEALRTTFAAKGDDAIQVIHEEPNLSFTQEDFAALTEAEQTPRVHEIIREEINKPYDLTSGPLFRARLLKLADDHHVLVVCMHHIVSDGWSIGILVNEFVAIYDALSKGEQHALPPLDIQYADFAMWQRDWLEGEALNRQIQYWKEHLDPNGFVLDLPTDFDRHEQGPIKGGVEELDIPAATLDAFKQLSNEEGATLFMSLMAVLDVVLHRYAGQDEINVGTPIAGRNRSEVEGLIGFFINTLVMGVDLSHRPTFRELIRELKEVALGAYAHQDLPFEKLVEELQPERDITRTPLFQVFFNLINLPEETNTLSGLTIESMDGVEVDQVSKFDLTLYAKETDQGLNLSVVYNANLFLPSRMQRMLQHFERLMEQVARQPDRPINEYDLHSEVEAEWQQHLAQPIVATPQPHPIRSIQEQAQQRADAIAIRDQEGAWTYNALDQVSNWLANRLQESGVEQGDLVLVFGPRSAALPVALTGVLKAGTAFSILDPAYPPHRLAEYAEQLDVKALITVGEVDVPSKLNQQLSAQSLHWRGNIATRPDNNQRSESLAKALPETVGTADPLAYVSFTSGSTGKPKAIANSLAPLAHFLQWYPERLSVTQQDRFSMVSGLAHDPLLRDLFVPLVSGATLHVPTAEDILQPGALSQWFENNAITHTHLTPAMAQLLMGEDEEQANPLTDLKAVVVGGDRLLPNLAESLNKLAPKAKLFNVYGATETPQIMLINEIDPAELADHPQIPLGDAVPNVEVLVLNEAKQIAAIGESGEIAIRTPYLAQGYLNDAELSEARFIQNRFCQEIDRIYLTGDKGRYADTGQVEFLGRVDDQIKIRGYRVEPGEIKNQLEALPEVQQAVVLLRPNDAGESWLVAYVVGPEQSMESVESLREALSKQLPDYMIPNAFVFIDKIPLTPNGKVDKTKLPPPSREFTVAAEYVAPRTDTEKAVAEIWEQVLKRSDISIKDNFFNIGGHSLLATRVVSRVRDQYGVEFNLKVLFEISTIEGMANYIDTTLWLREQNQSADSPQDDDEEREEFEL